MSAELWPVGAHLRRQEFAGEITGGTIETTPYQYLRFADAAGWYDDAPVDLGAIKTVAVLVALDADGPVTIERRSRLDAADAWGAWAPHGSAAVTARQVQVRLRPVGVPRVVRRLIVEPVSAV